MLYIKGMIISVGIAILLVDVFSIGLRIKKMLKLPLHKPLKPFDCLTCTAFWISLIICIIFTPSILNGLTLVTGTLITITIYEKWN